MASTPENSSAMPLLQQSDFEKITHVVTEQFQIEESLMEHGLPTYYLKQPQETKLRFLKLLKNLESMNLIALLRRMDNRIVLKVVPKPPVRKSNILWNWVLLFATIGTTFLTGYLLSVDFAASGLMSNPFIGAATFTIAIMTILGTHEMGHKLTANRNGVDATPPYFIPGPPPIGGLLGFGTFGAVIMQKSLAPNKDALFDLGSSGPIVGFILAAIATVIGLKFSPILPITQSGGGLPVPLFFELFGIFFINIPANYYVLLHPVAFAGWVGMIVTMLNLLPTSMLDGGHVARTILGDKSRMVLTFLSVLMLVVTDFWPMAILVLFMSMYKHPGPLDDVSPLSTRRKLLTVGLIVVFILCSFLQYLIYILMGVFGV
jgi:membrane-associated protease RseP (regulator of RpoE activity)